VSRPRVYLVNSHRWLFDRLTRDAAESEGFVIVDDKAAADIVIYLDPPWKDPDAPESLRSLNPRDVAKLYLFSQADDPIPWAPGVFTSLPRSSAHGDAFAGGFFIAHQHEPGGLGDHLVPESLTDCDLLWSFVGTAENASIRERILGLHDERGFTKDTKRWSDVVRWGWQADHRVEAQENFRAYARTLLRSKFVVCPRGRGLSSIRLFEALQVGRCPVVVSDEWLPPRSIDWSSCSIRIREDEVERLPAILRSRESEAAALGGSGGINCEIRTAATLTTWSLTRSS